MELLRTTDFYIIVNGDMCLFCNRTSGELRPSRVKDIQPSWNAQCLGIIYGLIGVVQTHPESNPKLILIAQRRTVQRLMGKHQIYEITKVFSLSLSLTNKPLSDISTCPKHQQSDVSNSGQSKAFSKTWNSLVSVADSVNPKKKNVREKAKFKKKILEEMLRMFNESGWFYYSDTYDLTSSIQRQYQAPYDASLPLCRRADDRFFWNKHLLTTLINNTDAELAEPWIVPILHGHLDVRTCYMDFSENHQDHSPGFAYLPPPLQFNILLISRRSRFRAGTRSKMRGLNEDGHCANYVETEQIIEFSPHFVSFVAVRASVPLFWSQTGYKYKPPLRIDKGLNESHPAFLTHISDQLDRYEKVCAINLTDLAGKELVLAENYLRHVLLSNHPDMSFVAFDFHEHCRGLMFDRVSVLTDVIKDIIKEMGYCWVDTEGMICQQSGVFRVNCVDCLDRTNVVQMAIARIVMETQVRKLGLLPPDETLPPSCQRMFQELWANNGDFISQQYAGTAALKADFTRTGKRKITGMVKDGMKSANRYYLRFRDAYRQAAIDLIVGQPIDEDLLSSANWQKDDTIDGNLDLIEKDRGIREMIEDCRQMLVVSPEQCLGTWSLVDSDCTDATDIDGLDSDVIVLLTQRAVYFAWFDEEKEQIRCFQRAYLEDIDELEIGTESSLFRPKVHCLRIHYRHFAQEGFFHSLQSSNVRVFNNMISFVQTQDDARECLLSIIESISAALEIFSINIKVTEKLKLDRKKPKPHPNIVDISSKEIQEASASAAVSFFNRSKQPTLPGSETARSKRILALTKQSISTKTNELKNSVTYKTKTALSKLNINFNNGNLSKLPLVHKRNLLRVNFLSKSKQPMKSDTDKFLISENIHNDIKVDPQPKVKRDLEITYSDVGTRERLRTSNNDVFIYAEEVGSGANDQNEEIFETKDAMLNSCGILATTERDLIRTSLSLDDDDDKLLPDICDLNYRGIIETDVSSSKTDSAFKPTNLHNNSAQLSDFPSDIDKESCEIEKNIQTEDLTSRISHDISSNLKLYHPCMKMSLSDGALTHGAPSHSALTHGAPADTVDESERSIMKLKSKLSNFVLHSTNETKRSQKSSASLNAILQDSINKEMFTKIIII